MNDGVTQAVTATQSATREPVLQISNGSKIYGGVHAIEGVNFDLYPGEVHALVGENGAGKSTLCKAIAGAINLTSGDYLLDGKPANFEQPRDALDAGICMVYQETSLVPTMTAAQNIELGNEKLLTRFRTLNIQAQQLLQSLNFHVDPATPVALLGTAKKQMVEIARAIYNKARIIIFDEPTASLTPEEIVHFFHLVRDLRARGVSIIYISHALEESLQIADRITVLRDGKLVITAPAKQLTRDALVQHMVGREVAQAVYGGKAKTHQRREKVLTVENVTMGMAVKNMSFSVYAGEVVGIAGLIGSGRTEIAKVVYGALKRNLVNGGTIRLRGKPIRYRVPRQAINDGIAYITEDRKANGFFETMVVDDNVYIGSLATRKGWSFLLSRARRSKLANYWVDRLKISALQRKAKIIELSGGNQQKVVLAKTLVQEPSIIFFDEPTRGVDVGTIPHIHGEIRRLADEGKAVVVISSYLPEILAVSDRILVARTGRIVAEFDAADATQDKILYAAVH
ncbi:MULTISPECIES: sugar ABC transporter ATP-binding protein [unclassified Bradyrhizobium]|uniref:sugar ABC transporter ATP-binding protein n=1 Tax=unclassified Bradyrhizobium TaxID=2631580 RepID=UPI001BA84067|nr:MULTISPECIES: sugar ABC transporter ATP-binding protein [unclassified Bradyrhizobium]MBR1202483.1 sugar ABC transporter ATP-binding protein [Bradyrhizobium sp. AUGA SZCCT0124]MBR1310948.1 sugar ABC transporter ATP-binding protein [Bradyrhizobium sp. AUGA SZCCT0051]MBR1339432.1 sugar ABC transporter ATP-binding protein [Bradyrhizobium sp. AUGA SZCCT0105]MBR1354006.1 sugar ABC transporter ATP-binding protein [Bradyrhizobium sp. AUGA SZCCT0045]